MDFQEAIFITKSKLSKHYFKTKDRKGLLYIVASVLNPTQKLTIFEVYFLTDYSDRILSYSIREILGNQITESAAAG